MEPPDDPLGHTATVIVVAACAARSSYLLLHRAGQASIAAHLVAVAFGKISVDH